VFVLFKLLVLSDRHANNVTVASSSI